MVTRHQSSPLPTPISSPHQNQQSSPVWVDDYNRRQAQFESHRQRHYLSPQPLMPYQKRNPNQFDMHTNKIKPLLPNYRPNMERNTNTAPILQRLFQAQQRQQ